MIKWLILIIVVIWFICFLLHCWKTKTMLLKIFNSHSVIVYGAKGKGKDLLFQKVISARPKKPYMSNINFGYKYIHKDIRELNLDPNTYENFICGAIIPIKHDDRLENIDYFLSDGGVFLPSQQDKQLHKNFKSLPLYYALSRHWYNSNVHVNTQALNRLWLPLREQADFYIKCKKSIKLGFIFVNTIVLYENYTAALNGVLPPKKRIFKGFNNALAAQHEWTHGYIEKRRYISFKWRIKYDTRIFKKILTGEVVE